jgi:hypothetical protein
MAKHNRKPQNIKPYTISVEGSLGLLAYGDIGLRAWREVKQKNKEDENKNEEK